MKQNTLYILWTETLQQLRYIVSTQTIYGDRGRPTKRESHVHAVRWIWDLPKSTPLLTAWYHTTISYNNKSKKPSADTTESPPVTLLTRSRHPVPAQTNTNSTQAQRPTNTHTKCHPISCLQFTRLCLCLCFCPLVGILHNLRASPWQ